MTRLLWASLLAAGLATPLAAQERRNWFDDPFLPVTAARSRRRRA
jgi:hypothetical protein